MSIESVPTNPPPCPTCGSKTAWAWRLGEPEPVAVCWRCTSGERREDDGLDWRYWRWLQDVTEVKL